MRNLPEKQGGKKSRTMRVSDVLPKWFRTQRRERLENDAEIADAPSLEKEKSNHAFQN